MGGLTVGTARRMEGHLVGDHAVGRVAIMG